MMIELIDFFLFLTFSLFEMFRRSRKRLFGFRTIYDATRSTEKSINLLEFRRLLLAYQAIWSGQSQFREFFQRGQS